MGVRESREAGPPGSSTTEIETQIAHCARESRHPTYPGLSQVSKLGHA